MPAPDRAWELVLRTIEQRLTSGALAPGDRLPGERILAAQLGVGRSSVREAVRVLEVLGLVRTQTGSGPQAGAILVARPHGGMSSLLRLQVAARGFAVEDIVDTRLVLEQAVTLALAARADRAERLEPARSLLEAMSVEDDPRAFLALDALFHTALAEASGNEVIAAIMAGLRQSIEEYVAHSAAALPSWPATVQRLRDEHAHLLELLTAGDAGAASDAVREHITRYYLDSHVPAGPAGTGRAPDPRKKDDHG